MRIHANLRETVTSDHVSAISVFLSSDNYKNQPTNKQTKNTTKQKTETNKKTN